MTDAIFILDREFENLREAYHAVLDLIPHTGSGPVLPQSFRFSIPRPEMNSAEATIVQDGVRSRGWLFAAPPEQDDLQSMALELERLEGRGADYRVTADRFSKHASMEIIERENRSIISIPFEDKVEHASRFFGRYVRPFSKVLGVFEGTVRAEFERFYDHAQRFLESELPLELRFRRMGWFSPAKSIRLTPRKGVVGRHTIFSQLWIHTSEKLELLRLFSELAACDRVGSPQIYFQAFVPSVSDYRPSIADERLLESTFDWNPENQDRVTSLVQALSDPSDAFLVLEHRPTSSGPVSVLYTLRKIPDRGYELRINPFWNEPEVDPDAWAEPIEDASGWSWNRIV